MTQGASQGLVIRAKPQPTIYTLLIIVAILVLAVTLGFVLYNLLAAPPNGYGLSFGDLFGPFQAPAPGR